MIFRHNAHFGPKNKTKNKKDKKKKHNKALKSEKKCTQTNLTYLHNLCQN